MSDEDETLAESIIDSMHSCADTFADTDAEVTLHEEGSDTEEEDAFQSGHLSPDVTRQISTPTQTDVAQPEGKS